MSRDKAKKRGAGGGGLEKGITRHTMIVTLVMRKKTAFSIGTAIRMNKHGAIRTS